VDQRQLLARDALQALTFTDVGDSPQNKYHIWVGTDSGLVEQWAYFADAADAEPGFVCPWRDWKRYGRIMLSGDRGELNGRPARLTGIAVFDELPESVFTSPDVVGPGAHRESHPVLPRGRRRPPREGYIRLSAFPGSQTGLNEEKKP
jgi:hypothetical protein